MAAIVNANRLIECLRKTVLRDGTARTDGQLLNSFVEDKDDAALASLVRRHGPMVWGVCSRMLGNHHDAEDAFQASFLVLVQKAPALPNKEMVGNWLYGVAHQTAVRVRALVAKRGAREKQVEVMPEATSSDQYLWNDLKTVLDEELACLPDKFRTLIVLCDLEGKTRKEVARQLTIPEGTVASRLAAARSMLARRLSRRGVVISGALLGTVLSSQAASAGVPMAVIPATIKTVTLVAAGQAVTALLSPTVAALVEGVVRAMFVTKIKSVLAVVLVVGLAFGGIGVGIGHSTNAVAVAQEKSPNKAPAKNVKSLDADALKRAEADLKHAKAIVEVAKAHLEQAQADLQSRKEALERLKNKKSEETLAKALEIAKAMELTDDGAQVRQLANIGGAQAKAGDKKGARKTFQLAFDLINDVGKKNEVHKVGCYSAIAVNQRAAGDFEGLRKTLAAVKNLRDKTDNEMTKLNAGFVESGIKIDLSVDQARAGDSKGALKVAEEIDDIHRKIAAYHGIAVEQAKRKEFSGAVGTVGKVDSIRNARMLMDIAMIHEKTDTAGAAKTWQRVVDALSKLELADDQDLKQIGAEDIIRNLADRGHRDAVVQWINGLQSPQAQIRLLLIVAEKK